MEPEATNPPTFSSSSAGTAIVPSTKRGPSSEQIDYALSRVRIMLGFLKTAASYDATVLPMGMAKILCRYPQVVIDRVTSPTGLASRNEWPSLKDLNDACIAEARHYDIMQRVPLPKKSAPPPRPAKVPGYRANVKVYPDAPQFPAVKMAVESGAVDAFDWRHDRDGAIWIALSVWSAIGSGALASTFRPMSDAELRAFYGVREAAAAKQKAAEDDPFAGL
jgi:hypothetical protein